LLVDTSAWIHLATAADCDQQFSSSLLGPSFSARGSRGSWSNLWESLAQYRAYGTPLAVALFSVENYRFVKTAQARCLAES